MNMLIFGIIIIVSVFCVCLLIGIFTTRAIMNRKNNKIEEANVGEKTDEFFDEKN